MNDSKNLYDVKITFGMVVYATNQIEAYNIAMANVGDDIDIIESSSKEIEKFEDIPEEFMNSYPYVSLIRGDVINNVPGTVKEIFEKKFEDNCLKTNIVMW